MKKEISEKNILDAALNVISENTISNTRMHMIAKEAGMSKTNLFYHFESKKELLLALLKDLQKTFKEQRRAEINKIDGNDVSKKVSGFLNREKNLLRENPKYDLVQFDFWTLSQSDPEIRHEFLESYKEWHKHIYDTLVSCCPKTDERQLSHISYIMITMMMGTAMQYLIHTEAFDLDEYFSICKTLLLDYIYKLNVED